MNKEFIIMRGMSGSGKSTLAKKLAGNTGQQFAADDYFLDDQGKYHWSGEKVSAAHQWNYERVKKAIDEGISPVILDNTSITKRDLRSAKPIVLYAESKGYDVRIEVTKTSWAFDADELVKRNQHGVNMETIQRQLRRWYLNPTIEDIKNDFKTD
jgi:NEDD4-binding protein 2